MGQKTIELGRAHNVNAGIISKPKTIADKINLLDERITSLTQTFNAISNAMIKDDRQQHVYDDINRDGIPIGTSFLGQSTRGGMHVLSVKQDRYYIGTSGYDSLSAAAEASSGVRRSGWTFWKTYDGKTVKEVYGKRNE